MRRSTYFIIAIACMLIYSCSSEGSATDASPSGKGGSLARFAIANDHLYAVDGTRLKVFDISAPNNLRFVNEKDLNVDVETAFARDSATLFIGTQQGMYIYDISQGNKVFYLSHYDHIVSCDPVVANETHAYVTLHTEERGASRCFRGVNQMDILNIEDLENIRLINSITMDSPKGLGFYGDTLFVCDNGLRIYDISQGDEPQMIDYETGIDAIDIISNKNILLISTSTGILQYHYHQGQLTFLSRI